MEKKRPNIAMTDVCWSLLESLLVGVVEEGEADVVALVAPLDAEVVVVEEAVEEFDAT